MQHDDDQPLHELFGSFMKPQVARLLHVLRLDKTFTRGEGSYLFTSDGQRTLDLAGGYGAALLGHGNRTLADEAARLHATFVPDQVQLSVPEYAARLASLLCQKATESVGAPYICTFANSGSEAVEAAIKHVFLVYRNKIEAFFEDFDLRSVHILAEASQRRGPVQLFRAQIAAMRREQEAAIKEPVIAAAIRSYHGQTLGALTLTYNKNFRESFLGAKGLFFNPEANELEAILKNGFYTLKTPRISPDGQTLVFDERQIQSVAGMIMEPIQGEGGVLPFSDDTLKKCTDIAHLHQTAVIIDEIQTGCYRTGYFLASSASGIKADYYVLGKALGGGIAKISACLIRKDILQEAYGVYHSTTFSDNNHAAAIALKAMRITEGLSDTIRDTGAAFLKMLQRLKGAYPDVIKSVRGAGLLLAIEFRSWRHSMSYAFQMIDRTGYLHYVAAGYLLNHWHIRCSAPLSATNTLRFHPTVCTSEEDILHLEKALRSLCDILRLEDTYKFIEYMLPEEHHGLRAQPSDFRNPDIPTADCPEDVMKVGFITHFIGSKTIYEADPSFAGIPADILEEMFDDFLPISTPFVIGSRIVHGADDQEVHLTLVGLPVTSNMCRTAIVRFQTQPFVRMCRQAIDLLADDGCSLVGLGQFSSILMKNGLASTRPDISVTTGNTFTARLGLDAIEAALLSQQRDPKQESLGVIGAGGNIASVYAQYASRWARRIVLLGSNELSGRRKADRTASAILTEAAQNILRRGARKGHQLEEWMAQSPVFQEFAATKLSFDENGFYARLKEAHPNDLPITVVNTLAEIHFCGVIVAATSAPEPFLRPEHFQANTIICDISVPLNCTPELLNNTKNIRVISGGLAVLPHREAMPMRAFPLPEGQVFGCLAETLLLGLAKRAESFSFGRISCDKVDEIGDMAAHFGFSLFDKNTSWY